MSNALYPSAKQGFIDKLFDMNSDDIRMSAIDLALYTYSATHDEYSGGARDVPLASIVAESAQLTSPTIINGVFDTDNFTFTAATGNTFEALIQWNNTLANDRLILYLDQGVTGLPMKPNGGNITGTVDPRGFWAL